MADNIVTKDGRSYTLLTPNDLPWLVDLYLGRYAADRVQGMLDEIDELALARRNDQNAFRKILDIAEGFDENAPAALLAKRIGTFINDYTEL